ncbi:MAG: hypothetical protein K8Q92_02680 [Methylophilales bacterium]|nr:hypothetical protein [Methylophilales bacterium]
MSPFFHFLFRLIKAGIGTFLLWVAFYLLPSFGPFSLSAGIPHFIYSALAPTVFVYLAYALIVYLIGGKPLVEKLSYTRWITNTKLSRIIFRLLALALGLGGLWVLYDHYILGNHPDLFSHWHGRKSGPGTIVFLTIIFLIYGIRGTDLFEREQNKINELPPAHKQSLDNFTWVILILVIVFAIWMMSLGVTH